MIIWTRRWRRIAEQFFDLLMIIRTKRWRRIAEQFFDLLMTIRMKRKAARLLDCSKTTSLKIPDSEKPQ
jgi:hypothetical protein